VSGVVNCTVNTDYVHELARNRLSTDQVENELGVDWNTAKKDLDALYDDSYLDRNEGRR